MADTADSAAPVPDAFEATLRSLTVWDSPLPPFDPSDAPAAPLPLFRDWFVAAARAGQAEPHAVHLATVDPEGRPTMRTVILHGADERGWHFASHSTSARGRQLAARPQAALGFYWPVQGRQVRCAAARVSTGTAAEAYGGPPRAVRGRVTAALGGPGRGEPLPSWRSWPRRATRPGTRARTEPDAHAPTWTRYRVRANLRWSSSRATPAAATSGCAAPGPGRTARTGTALAVADRA